MDAILLLFPTDFLRTRADDDDLQVNITDGEQVSSARCLEMYSDSDREMV